MSARISPAAAGRKPRVGIVVLGGTITMTPQASGGIAPTVSGDDLVAAVPQLAGVAEVEVATPFLVPGASLTFADIAAVARIVSDAARSGAVDGVVVVQGTDTIDETAFLLDLVHDGTLAAVVTGAMRGTSAPGADGHANLLAAVTVAAAPEAKGEGVLVVLNDEVHAARLVQKMDTGLPSAFASPGSGPLGTVSEGALRLRTTLRRNRPPLQVDIAAAAPVAIVKTGLGDDGRLIGALAGLGFKGAVIEAMGAGHVPQALVEAVGDLAAAMPVVLASRVPGGPVFTRSYGFPGSEIDLLGRGLVAAGGLPPHKARLLLSLLVAAGRDRDAIAADFRSFA